MLAVFTFLSLRDATAVHLVFNPFSQFVPQLELYSQLQLSLWSDPIAFSGIEYRGEDEFARHNQFIHADCDKTLTDCW